MHEVLGNMLIVVFYIFVVLACLCSIASCAILVYMAVFLKNLRDSLSESLPNLSESIITVAELINLVLQHTIPRKAPNPDSGLVDLQEQGVNYGYPPAPDIKKEEGLTFIKR